MAYDAPPKRGRPRKWIPPRDRLVTARERLSRLDLAAATQGRRLGGAGLATPSDLEGGPGTYLRHSLGSEFRSKRSKQSAAVSTDIKFFDWSIQIPEPKSGKLDFDRFPFQRALYSEEIARCEECVVEKATQLGISAWLFRWVYFWADIHGLNSLYVFPKLKQMYDFSDARVSTSITKSKYLSSRIPSGSVSNKGLKQIGNGWVYFRGSESEDDLNSVDADALALDEYDSLVPANVPVAERRTSGSELGLLRRVGVPTIPNHGINKLYQDTDRRRWLVNCGHGHELPLTFPNSVDLERKIRVCGECRVELTPQKIAAGRWVAENPGAEIPGFHMPRLIVPGLRLAPLIRDSKKTLPEERQAFWNRDLGEAYAPAEGRLSPEAIAAAQSKGAAAGAQRNAGGYNGGDFVTMGVDVASTRDLNVRISRHHTDGAKMSLFIGRVATFDDIEKMMSAYNVHIACIDHLPEGRLARGLAAKFPGRVYLVNYASNQKDVLVIDEERRSCSVRRVEAVDATFAMIREQRNLLPADLPPSYVEEMGNLIRYASKADYSKKTADGKRGADGKKEVRYLAQGADDFAHAETYDLVASELYHLRTDVIEGTEGEMTRLEDQMEFERSLIHEDDEDGYNAGPDGDVY